jgi:hypothetical protein
MVTAALGTDFTPTKPSKIATTVRRSVAKTSVLMVRHRVRNTAVQF